MILVIGDIMLDRYIDGQIHRIAQEAPVPVFQADAVYRHCAGGAANVAHNIAALGERVMLLGAIGADIDPEVLRGCFGEHEVDLRLVAAGHTTRKTRYMVGGKQVFRVDREDVEAWFTANELLAALGDGVEGVSAIVISDYDKFVVSKTIGAWAIAAAKRLGIPIIVDPKPPRLMELWTAATVVKMNASEATAAGIVKGELPREGVMLVTNGAEGMDLYERGGWHHIPAYHPREVFDVVGAGDTVAAALAVALARGHSVRWASHFANAAAGVVVSKSGTATASMAEIEAVLDNNLSET